MAEASNWARSSLPDFGFLFLHLVLNARFCETKPPPKTTEV